MIEFPIHQYAAKTPSYTFPATGPFIRDRVGFIVAPDGALLVKVGGRIMLHVPVDHPCQTLRFTATNAMRMARNNLHGLTFRPVSVD